MEDAIEQKRERSLTPLVTPLDIPHNSGKRWRPIRPAGEANTQAMAEQQDCGF